MLYILFSDDYTKEEAAAATGRKYAKFVDAHWSYQTDYRDLNNDPVLKRLLKNVDQCDLPYPNVVLDIRSNTTHSFDRISSGVKTLWLMQYCADTYLFSSAHLGENCFQDLLDISKTVDVYVYENSDMLYRKVGDHFFDECTGEFTDYKTGIVTHVVPGKLNALDYGCFRGEEVDVLDC